MQKDELFQMALMFMHVFEGIGIEIVIAGDTRDVQVLCPTRRLSRTSLDSVLKPV